MPTQQWNSHEVGGAPGAKVWLHNSHRSTEDGLCIAMPERVAADTAAGISAETAMLIAGSNEDLVS